MRQTLTVVLVGLSLALGACESGGVGDPCIPEDEYRDTFGGFDEREVNIESRSFQCETRLCLVANFRGRVSCPYGQDADGSECWVPGSQLHADDADRVKPAVPPQAEGRQPDDAVYCSCRCAGDNAKGTLCECPSGFECQKLIDNFGLGDEQLVGSYCIREGKHVPNPRKETYTPCVEGRSECGDKNPHNIPAN